MIACDNLSELIKLSLESSSVRIPLSHLGMLARDTIRVLGQVGQKVLECKSFISEILLPAGESTA